MKKILIINPGSTSTKYKIFNLKGFILDERTYKINEKKEEREFFSGLENISKIGIRVVHGGEISKTSKITKSLKKKISEYILFAPIHNARALEVIEKVERFFPKASFFATFDTAFHSTISEDLYTYPIKPNLAKKYKLRKYGFHGLAAESALLKFKELKKQKREKIPNNIIFAHLGGGCSVTAVKNGKSFSTSMGLTPISGIMMTTRVGDIDSDFDKILAHQMNTDINEVSRILNYESGFYGMTGTKDTLKIFNAAQSGKKKEKLAFDIFVNNLVEKIYAYAGLMGGLDAIVFSGGIGYGNKFLRDTLTKKMKLLSLTKKDIFAIDVDEELLIFNKIKNNH